jgi:hypothetical protein
MHSRVARLLVRLYPHAWRDRYGDEFLALTEDTDLGWWRACDVVSAAAEERVILVVRRVLGDGREDAVIRNVARLIVQFVLAWLVVSVLYAVFPVAAATVGVILRLCGWDAVARQSSFMGPPYTWVLRAIWVPVFLALECLVVAPVVLALKLAGFGRARAVAARLSTIALIVFVGVLWQLWWEHSGPWWLRPLRLGLSLAGGGTVIAFALFPRVHENPTIKPPRLVPA